MARKPGMLEFDRLDTYLAEGRLIRGDWTGTDAQARETACLLAALYPRAGAEQSADACPAALMPPWLAHLTVWIDDNGTLAAWPGHVRRYAAVIRGVVALDAGAQAALSRRIRGLIVREAVSHVTVDDWGVRAACEQTVAALDSGNAGQIAAAAWTAQAAVRAAVRAAGRAAACAAARAAEAAAEAAEAAVTEAAGAAAWAAWAAATESAWAAGAAGAAAWAAAEDRLIDGMLVAMGEATR
jgi:hypothetical protein